MRQVEASGATFAIRPATEADVPAIEELIELSVRGLQAGDYSPMEIEGALQSVFGCDRQLVADRTYFVVEAGPVIVGCGGWSNRKTLFGGDRWSGREDDLLDPARDRAKIRAFFVHPDWARRGIGSLLLNECEGAAKAAGFRSFEMGATVTGEKLYRMRGYVEVERIAVPLGNGEALPIIRMEKHCK